MSAQNSFENLEYEEQAVICMMDALTKESTPTVGRTLQRISQSILNGDMYDEHGEERVTGIKEGIMLIIDDLIEAEKDSIAKTALRVARGCVRDEDFHEYHPDYQA